LSLITFPKRKILFTFFGCWVVLVVLEAYAYADTFGFDWTIALADAVDMNLLIATAWFSVFNGLKYYQPGPSRAFYLVIWSLVLACICEVIHTLFMGRMFAQDESYQHFISNSHLIRGLVLWLMITLVAILSWIWYYIQEQRDSEMREQDAARLAKEAELASLRQQLQPHFLFNSLNSISALAGSRPEQARKMIQQLSDFLRGTIKRDDHQLVTLQEELTHLELYLDIEKVRFGHRLRTDVTRDEASAGMKLPSLLLQPIVENAIKFGLYDTTGEITIALDARGDEGHLVITVSNPFDPATSAPRRGTGFGLNAVERRLYLLYARNDLLITRQETTDLSLFITQLRIPQAS
jgi:two-component system, LytTR family, sensor kinase